MKILCNKLSIHTKILNSFFCFGLITSSQAETITIGRGTGVVWEGFYFNETMSGPWATQTMTTNAIMSISTSSVYCISSSALVNIAGYLAFPIAQGVGLIPRVSGNASFFQNFPPPSGPRNLSATIGIPETAGTVSPTNTQVQSSPNTAWCLPPSMNGDHQFYGFGSSRTVNLSGRWVLVADGTQRTGNYNIPPMYFASHSGYPAYSLSTRILPSNISLRVSTLNCTVNTPVNINFGTVSRSVLPSQELAIVTNPINVNCNQNSDLISADINVQFRATSGLYNANPSQLSLKQGGGYITGEISSSITGSGDCALSQGLRLDNTPYKLGEISNTETSVVINKQITWRLCSGGDSLPTGPVDASTEMLITFN
ncbi:hypothetical protein [Serratia oryzae]|uniref:hypothetical protein n=1 Tax=Serratia oryzae TaxID=2034155 RepID=UPI001F4F91F1|nr:hypothetical protein [Serratia oryzae]